MAAAEAGGIHARHFGGICHGWHDLGFIQPLMNESTVVNISTAGGVHRASCMDRRLMMKATVGKQGVAAENTFGDHHRACRRPGKLQEHAPDIRFAGVVPGKAR